MLNIIGLLLGLVDRHVIWLYLGCLTVVLYDLRTYVQARRDRDNTIFPIEREVAAQKSARALSGIGVMLGIALVITLLKYYVVPTVDTQSMVAPTPTLGLGLPTRALPTETPTITLTAVPGFTPTSTPAPSPTRPETPTRAPTAAGVPGAASAGCADANVCITNPRGNAEVSGQVAILGSANHDQFQFYKIELAVGDVPTAWTVVNATHGAPVLNGILERLDTTRLANGVYWLQLTVVDLSGNYPPPSRVRFTIRN